MLELICQQRYRANGASVDASRYRNHGTAIDAPSVPSSSPAHHPIRFPNSDSGVWIRLGTLNAWNPLVALKIEVDARLEPAPEPGMKLGLVHGDRAFSFYLNSTEDGSSVLVAQVAGPPIIDLRSSATAPVNRWVTLGLYHDGFATLQLLIDGKVIAQTNVTRGVPAVQGGGVIIGNTLAGGAPLLSEINEARIWRLDPRQLNREFLCRPYSAATASCWEAMFRKIQQWRTNHPTEAKPFIDRISAQQRGFVHGFLSMPPADRKEGDAILNDYARLWCKGHIDHEQMRHVLRRWLVFLHSHGLDVNSGPSSPEIQAAMQRSGIDINELSVECDPAVRGFFRMLGEEFQSVTGRIS